MRKTAAAAAMAASLTIGGGAGAVLFAPNLVGAQSDETSEESDATDDAANQDGDRPERGDFLADALAPLVEDGTIDQAQADAVIEAIQEARPDRPRGKHGKHHLRHVVADEVLDILGVTAEELRDARRDGQSIADVAAANGVEVDAVIDAIVAEISDRIEAAVDNGRLTEEEADEKLAEVTERVTAMVNGERPGDAPEGS